MKKENGITLVSLIIYIVAMVIVLAAIGTISNNFYKNMSDMEDSTKDILEFGNFNTYFLKEIKSTDNKVDSIGENGNYILFSSGNSFSISNNKIYFNDKIISKGVQSLNFVQDINNNKLITVNVKFENFERELQYKVENIY